MKKTFYSILFLFAGLLSGQTVNAQETEIIYTSDFTKNSFNSWIPEGAYAEDGLWSINSGLLCAHGTMVFEECESRLVSPFIQLGVSNNTVSLDYMAFNFTDMPQEIRLFVREENGEWGNVILSYPEYSGPFNTGELPVPSEYNGKNVQFAFVYSLLSWDIQGSWMINNFTVKGSNEAAVEKKEAGISYDVTEVTYTIGDKDFKAPILNNPNNLMVYYSSENESVAIINEDGSLEIVAPGKALIRALSPATDEFKKGEASYVLTVVDPKIVFSAEFTYDECGFVEEKTCDNNVWAKHSSSMSADGFGKTGGEAEALLVSPVMTLRTNNVMSFDFTSNYFAPERIDNDMRMAIRLVGGEWTYLEIPNRMTVAYEPTNSGEIVIPTEFDNKEVQVAFAYACDGSAFSGIWDVYNLVIKVKNEESSKKNPQLSFAVDSYDFVFNKSQFPGIELNNPYGVEVYYEIKNNDYSVADVEPYTGIVWVYDYGTVVITAKFDGNDEYNAAEASYTLNIIEETSTSIESITAEDINDGKVYDLQGRRVNKLDRGVYIVNGKKVIIK